MRKGLIMPTIVLLLAFIGLVFAADAGKPGSASAQGLDKLYKWPGEIRLGFKNAYRTRMDNAIHNRSYRNEALRYELSATGSSTSRQAYPL